MNKPVDPFANPSATAEYTIAGISAELDALLDSIKVSHADKARVAGGDVSKLTEAQTTAVCGWYAESCGLHPMDVCAFKVEGRTKVYVKASGVLRKARDKVESITHSSPTFHGANGRLVVIECVVVMKDKTSWHDIAARELVDSKSIMACSTAATVRALRLAVGIPIPSENEL